MLPHNPQRFSLHIESQRLFYESIQMATTNQLHYDAQMIVLSLSMPTRA